MNGLHDDPTPAIFIRLNQNIHVLDAAIEEIEIWIDKLDSTETYLRVSKHLETLADKSDAIAESLVDLIARWVLRLRQVRKTNAPSIGNDFAPLTPKQHSLSVTGKAKGI